jgi:hypothetical protein
MLARLPAALPDRERVSRPNTPSDDDASPALLAIRSLALSRVTSSPRRLRPPAIAATVATGAKAAADNDALSLLSPPLRTPGFRPGRPSLVLAKSA